MTKQKILFVKNSKAEFGDGTIAFDRFRKKKIENSPSSYESRTQMFPVVSRSQLIDSYN